MNYAIIAAGGKGKRFQSTHPKQLLPLLGRPVLSWTLQPFIKAREIDRIVIAYPPDEDESDYRSILEQENLLPRVRLVKGGESRYRSVRNAFESIESPQPADLVLIHDAARPLLRQTLLKTLMESALKSGTAVPVLPVHETVKKVQDGRVQETLMREHLFLSQTPQVFRYEILAAAYADVSESAEITDEAMMVEKSGREVHVVPGDRKNVKITESADFELVEFYISKGWE